MAQTQATLKVGRERDDEIERGKALTGLRKWRFVMLKRGAYVVGLSTGC